MGRVSTEVKSRALELIRAGHSKATAAEMTGVRYPTIDKWSKELDSQTRIPPAVAVENGAVTNVGPVLVSPGKVVPLERQLDGMNTETGILPTIAQGEASTTPPLPSAPGNPSSVTATAPVPDMAPEALLAIVKLTKSGLIAMVATGYGLNLDHKELDRLSSFTPGEEEQMKVLAPFAASYMGQFEQYTRPIMACLFFGCVGLSSMRSFKELKAMRPPKAQKPAIDPGPKAKR